MIDEYPHKVHEIQLVSDMKTFQFSIASLNIELNCLYGSHLCDFKGYLAHFQKPDISIHILHDELDREVQYHPEILALNLQVNDKRVAVTYDYGCLEQFVAFRKLADAIIPFDMFLMHGAVIEKDGYAYMFTAPSGTGKSTRIKLWKECYPDSIVINGDKPFIKITSKEIVACGTPWCGKEGWNTNKMVPLRAIFLLERSGQNVIQEISLSKAFPILLQQTHWSVNSETMQNTIRLLKTFDGRVKIYRYMSTPTVEAIRLAYETARPK